MDAATKKLFSLVDDLGKKIEQLDSLEARLTALDTNGRLDSVKKEMEGLRKAMNRVATNSRLVVAQVESHGGVLHRLEEKFNKLDLKCPLLVEDEEGSVPCPACENAAALEDLDRMERRKNEKL